MAFTTLWRTDGTMAGTAEVDRFFLNREDEVNPGRRFARGASGEYYYIAEDELYGAELFVSAGQPPFAGVVSDVFLGPVSSAIDNLIAFKDHVYFTAVDGRSGRELYAVNTATDDIFAELTLDLNANESSSIPQDFAVVNGRLVFTAEAGCTGRELYTTDGGAASTIVLEDTAPGPDGIGAFRGASLGDELFYLSGRVGQEKLYRSDGTRDGTSVVTGSGSEVSLPRFVGEPLALSGKLYVPGLTGNNEAVVLSYDPQDGTVTTVASFLEDGFLPFGPPILYALRNGNLGIQVSSSSSNVLYGLDPADNNLDELASLSGEEREVIYVAEDGYAYFPNGTGGGEQIFRTDGTPSGTIRYSALPPQSVEVRVLKADPSSGGLFYTASTGGNGGALFVLTSNGAASTPITYAGGVGVGVTQIAFLEGRTIITGSNSALGNELYVLNAGATQATLLLDIAPGPFSSNPGQFIELDGRLYFTASTDLAGRELWRTDGTSAGTERLSDINPGPADANPLGLFDWNGVLYFCADDGLVGKELWRYDPADPNGMNANNDPNAVPDFCFVVGTDETADLDISLSVYPNPASSEVTVEVDGVDSFELTVFDVAGRAVARSSGLGGQVTLRLENVEAGVYFIRVVDPASGERGTRQVIVRR